MLSDKAFDPVVFDATSEEGAHVGDQPEPGVVDVQPLSKQSMLPGIVRMSEVVGDDF